MLLFDTNENVQSSIENNDFKTNVEITNSNTEQAKAIGDPAIIKNESQNDMTTYNGKQDEIIENKANIGDNSVPEKEELSELELITSLSFVVVLFDVVNEVFFTTGN
jgi:hypothetical protein